jgi:hypothetical protein
VHRFAVAYLCFAVARLAAFVCVCIPEAVNRASLLAEVVAAVSCLSDRFVLRPARA